jgi:LPXTG-motif cell wall-anchored protein
MKRWHLLLVPIIPLFTFWGVYNNNSQPSAFSKTREFTLLRNVGHQLLLSSGDSHSRILPIEKSADGSYRLRFETATSFKPDSLVGIISRNFPNQNEYSAEVIDGSKKEVVYSFVKSPDSTRSIIPCRNRDLPLNNYELVIRMPTSDGSSSAYYLAGFTALLMIGGGWYLIKKQKQPPPNEPVSAPLVESSWLPLGRFRFHTTHQKLELDGQFIELTGKEGQLLHIFAKAPNTIIERSRLQKEVWEDEGVIVTRSLDMFVSKLRKKLEADPTVRIVNVHGKGYRLEVG